MKKTGTHMLLNNWKKYQIYLDADILSANGTSKSSAQAWHHNL